MLDATQTRTARAALGWTAQDLAKRAGLHVNTLNKFEVGHTDIRRSTLEKLWEVFTAEGIEFPDPQSVRWRPRRSRAMPEQPVPRRNIPTPDLIAG